MPTCTFGPSFSFRMRTVLATSSVYPLTPCLARSETDPTRITLFDVNFLQAMGCLVFNYKPTLYNFCLFFTISLALQRPLGLPRDSDTSPTRTYTWSVWLTLLNLSWLIFPIFLPLVCVKLVIKMIVNIRVLNQICSFFEKIQYR
jgi:hypothetical protein